MIIELIWTQFSLLSQNSRLGFGIGLKISAHLFVKNQNDLFTKKTKKVTKDFRDGKLVVQYHISGLIQ